MCSVFCVQLFEVDQQNHAGAIDADSPYAMRFAMSCAVAFRGMTATWVRDTLQATFEKVLVLPVTRETATSSSTEPAANCEAVKDLLTACEVGFADSPDISDTWEESVRELLEDSAVKEYVQGLRVPVQEQVETLAKCIEGIIENEVPGSGVASTSTASTGNQLIMLSFGDSRSEKKSSEGEGVRSQIVQRVEGMSLVVPAEVVVSKNLEQVELVEGMSYVVPGEAGVGEVVVSQTAQGVELEVLMRIFGDGMCHTSPHM